MHNLGKIKQLAIAVFTVLALAACGSPKTAERKQSGKPGSQIGDSFQVEKTKKKRNTRDVQKDQGTPTPAEDKCKDPKKQKDCKTPPPTTTDGNTDSEDGNTDTDNTGGDTDTDNRDDSNTGGDTDSGDTNDGGDTDTDTNTGDDSNTGGDTEPGDSDEEVVAVRIHQDALEKEFLLRVQLIEQLVAHRFHGMKSRVVNFTKRGNDLIMRESQEGHTVSTDSVHHIVLAKFPIVSTEGGWIEIDFNAGMSSIYMHGDWDAADFSGVRYKPTFNAVRVENSYVEDAKMVDNVLVIRQIAQLASEGSRDPIEAKYYLSPYLPDATYKPAPMPGYKHVGFFNNASQLSDRHQEGVVYSARFHPDKPIVYAVSSNTPEAFKQAVKDGILYWNNVFGSDKLQAVDAPEGVSAPSLKHNIVQWVDWDAASGAYADAQVDPRTGQILNAQVFMTSVFAMSGAIRARLGHQKHGSKPSEKVFGLKNFETSRLCDLDFEEQLREVVAKMESGGEMLSEEAQLKIAQDFVRHVVAHEVGHTLGMRHNFAGSLVTNFALKDRDSIYKSYLADKKAPEGVVTTSSVMEYQPFVEAALTGDQMLRGWGGEYDKKAIGILYKGETPAPSEIPPFCTDSHRIEGYADCKTRDTGSSVIEYTVWSVQDQVNNLPYRIMNRYILAKAPFGGSPRPLESVTFNPVDLAMRTLADRVNMFGLLTNKGRLIQIRRQAPVIGPMTSGAIRARELEYTVAEIEKLGAGQEQEEPLLRGLRVLFDLAVFQQERAKFIAMIDSGMFNKGVAISGKPYEFTPEELNFIKNQGNMVYAYMEAYLGFINMMILNGHPLSARSPQALQAYMQSLKLVDHPVNDTLLQFFKELTQRMVFERSTSRTINFKVNVSTDGQEKEVEVKLPRFNVPTVIRQLAASLITVGRSTSIGWGWKEKAELLNEYASVLAEPLQGVPLDASILPKEPATWFIENFMSVMEVMKGPHRDPFGMTEENVDNPAVQGIDLLMDMNELGNEELGLGSDLLYLNTLEDLDVIL